MGTHLGTTERHLPYGIAQCYLPLDTGERAPPLTSARQAYTQFTYPRGIEGCFFSNSHKIRRQTIPGFFVAMWNH